MVRHRTPPSHTWRSFLDNHANDLVSLDFFTLPTATFRVLFVFIVLRHERRRIVHFQCHRTSFCRVDGAANGRCFSMGHGASVPGTESRPDLRSVLSILASTVSGSSRSLPHRAPRGRIHLSERMIGSIRRECLDHVIVLDERHLKRILRKYVDYYHSCRTHLSLEKDAPEPRRVESPAMGKVRAIPKVGGLPSLLHSTRRCLSRSRRVPKTQTNSRPAWTATSRCRWLNSLDGISGQPDGRHMVVCPQRPRAGRWRASVPCGRPLRMASRSPWTPASKLILNSTVLTVEPGETEPTAKLPARVRQQTDETPVDDAMPFFELGPERQTHARPAVLARAECHAQVAADRSRLEELFEFFEMRGTFRRFTHPLVADTFGQRNPAPALGSLRGAERGRAAAFLLAGLERMSLFLGPSFISRHAPRCCE